jgi:hypothetical protein
VSAPQRPPTRRNATAAKPSESANGVAHLALRREAAARALGVSDETFDKHVRPSLPVVRLGSVRVYPVAALERWLLEHADSPAAELERAR